MATMPGLGVFFGTGVQADLANSNMNTMYWEQGGLGLGDVITIPTTPKMPKKFARHTEHT